jgi:hypothetical protein
LNSRLKPYFFIALVFILAFLPILSFVFGVKNDILTGYLPVKFFMSESISSGYFPWWNPYVNFGIPQHADMSSGFWSPITWLISTTAGYNVYTITLELLFYIFIAGIGMYKVTGLWQLNKHVRIIAAISYMCSGYTIAHIQHINWIAGAAFLPWCFFSYQLMLKQFSFYRIAVAVCCFYLFISSSHPGLIIGAFYYFFIFSVYHFGSSIRNKTSGTTSIGIQLSTIILFFLLLLLALGGMLVSYTEILPFITRGDKPVTVPQTPLNTIYSLLSFVLPFSTVKNIDVVTGNLSMKNFYIGLLPLLFFIASFPLIKKIKESSFFLVTGILFLFISVTGIIQGFVYKYVPLFTYVRGSREFRVFALFSFIILAAIAMHHFLTANEKNQLLKRIIWLMVGFVGLLILYSLITIFITHQSFLYSNSQSVAIGSFRDYLKKISDSFSFYDAALLQGIFQIILLLFLKKYLLLKNSKALVLICAIDIIAASAMNLPFTGYGKLSAKEIQTELNRSPKGIPVPAIQPIILNDTGTEKSYKTIGSWSFYNKQPGTVTRAAYPIQFNSEILLFSKPVMDKLSLKPMIFFTSATELQAYQKDSAAKQVNANNYSLQLKQFSPSSVLVSLQVNTPGIVTLLYQDYPHWKVLINGKEATKKNNKETLIIVDIPSSGSYDIEYNYNPQQIKTWSVIGLTIFLFLCLFICVKKCISFIMQRKQSYN